MAISAQSAVPKDDEPVDWASFFALCDSTEIPADFLSFSQLDRWTNRPALFEGWAE